METGEHNPTESFRVPSRTIQEYREHIARQVP